MVQPNSISDAASLATWLSECVRGLRAYGRSSSIRSCSMLPGWKRRSVMKTLVQKMRGSAHESARSWPACLAPALALASQPFSYGQPDSQLTL